jgi:hypothetical protein
MDVKCDCMHNDCNYCWNEDVFYQLHLEQVWTHNGTWIPDHLRYPEGWVDQLDWYTYCDTFHIPWEAARLLPWWAMEEMDQYHRDNYYRYTERDTLVEENM